MLDQYTPETILGGPDLPQIQNKCTRGHHRNRSLYLLHLPCASYRLRCLVCGCAVASSGPVYNGLARSVRKPDVMIFRPRFHTIETGCSSAASKARRGPHLYSQAMAASSLSHQLVFVWSIRAVCVLFACECVSPDGCLGLRRSRLSIGSNSRRRAY